MGSRFLKRTFLIYISCLFIISIVGVFVLLDCLKVSDKSNDWDNNSFLKCEDLTFEKIEEFDLFTAGDNVFLDAVCVSLKCGNDKMFDFLVQNHMKSKLKDLESKKQINLRLLMDYGEEMNYNLFGGLLADLIKMVSLEYELNELDKYIISKFSDDFFSIYSRMNGDDKKGGILKVLRANINLDPAKAEMLINKYSCDIQEIDRLYLFALLRRAQKKFSSALTYFSKHDSMCTLENRPNLLPNLFVSFRNNGFLDKAHVYFQNEIDTIRRNDYDEGFFSASINLAKTLTLKGDTSSALLYLKPVVKEIFESEMRYEFHLPEVYDFLLSLKNPDVFSIIEFDELDFLRYNVAEVNYQFYSNIQEFILQRSIKAKKKLSNLKMAIFAGIFILLMFVFVVIYRMYLLRLKLAAAEEFRNVSMIQGEMAEKHLNTLKVVQEVDNNYIEKFTKKVMAANTSNDIRKLRDEINYLKDTRDDRIEYLKKVKVYASDLYPLLLSINNNLTNLDLLHCSFLKLNYSVAEVAKIQNVAKSSVRSTRSRLKKKLRLAESENLMVFIQELK